MPITLPPQLKPIAPPSAWQGKALAQQPEQWTYRLSVEEISELETAAGRFLDSGQDLALITANTFPLPTLSQKLKQLRQTLVQGIGFQLWKGLPTIQYPIAVTAAIFCGLGAHLGKACSQNASGHLLGHVKDTSVNARDGNVRIYQTAERQTFHTDSADVVGLLCLQTAKQGGDSMLVSTAGIYNAMCEETPELAAELFKPIATDRRGEVPEGEKPYFEIPVFNWFNGQLTGIYQRQYIESAQRHPGVPALTPEYIAAMDEFDRLANDPDLHLSMRLEPGDMQFVHNHSLLHDRTGFTDWPETEKRRHLLRLWLSVPGDRTLPEVFKQRFGSVTVGNRGGIMTTDTQLQVPLAG